MMKHGFDDDEALNPSNAKATFTEKNKNAKNFEYHLIPVMLVFIG